MESGGGKIMMIIFVGDQTETDHLAKLKPGQKKCEGVFVTGKFDLQKMIYNHKDRIRIVVFLDGSTEPYSRESCLYGSFLIDFTRKLLGHGITIISAFTNPQINEVLSKGRGVIAQSPDGLATCLNHFLSQQH